MMRESVRDGTHGWCDRERLSLADVGANNRTEKQEFQLYSVADLLERHISTRHEPNRPESSKGPVDVYRPRGPTMPSPVAADPVVVYRPRDLRSVSLEHRDPADVYRPRELTTATTKGMAPCPISMPLRRGAWKGKPSIST